LHQQIKHPQQTKKSTPPFAVPTLYQSNNSSCRANEFDGPLATSQLSEGKQTNIDLTAWLDQASSTVSRTSKLNNNCSNKLNNTL
jgi:hypothetical protein